MCLEFLPPCSLELSIFLWVKEVVLIWILGLILYFSILSIFVCFF